MFYQCVLLNCAIDIATRDVAANLRNVIKGDWLEPEKKSSFAIKYITGHCIVVLGESEGQAKYNHDKFSVKYVIGQKFIH